MSDDEYASSVSVSDSDQDVEFDNLQVAIGPQDGAPNNNVDKMSDSQLLAEVEHLQNEGSGDPAQGAVQSVPEDAAVFVGLALQLFQTPSFSVKPLQLFTPLQLYAPPPPFKSGLGLPVDTFMTILWSLLGPAWQHAPPLPPAPSLRCLQCPQHAPPLPPTPSARPSAASNALSTPLRCLQRPQHAPPLPPMPSARPSAASSGVKCPPKVSRCSTGPPPPTWRKTRT